MTDKFNFDIEVVRELYKIFNKSYPIIDNNDKKLLSIGFKNELQEATGLSKQMIKNFLKWYCNIEYRKLVKAGESRYNLKGEIVGIVTEDEEEHANKKIDHHKLIKYQETFVKVLEKRRNYKIEEFNKTIEKIKQNNDERLKQFKKAIKRAKKHREKLENENKINNIIVNE